MGDAYDPFLRGRFSQAVRTVEMRDERRNRDFKCEIWYPQSAGTFPLIGFSHFSGGHRRASSFLCEHLSSHGYIVAALDHSEVSAPELAPKTDETPEQKASRAAAWIANRVPDMRFLLDRLLNGDAWRSEAAIDADSVGLAGHSFGGWTVLAAVESDPRVRAVVALAPGGSSQTKPGILKLSLTFDWRRDVPALYLVAEKDTSLPLEGMYELYERTPATKQMVILRTADHLHFIDDVEGQHEMVRKMDFGGELAWMKEMLPISELVSGKDAHLFVRGLTVAHFDAYLKRQEAAQTFLAGDIEEALAARGIASRVYP